MTDFGTFSALAPDLLDKLLTDHELSFSDLLSWHVACPRLFTRSTILTCSLRYYARVLFLDENYLSKNYSPEADPKGAFLRQLAASEEAQAKREGVVSVTPFRTLAARTNGDVVMCGKALAVAGSTETTAEILYTPTVMLKGYGPNKPRVKVVGGLDHALVLNHSGEVFAMGANQHGECGRPSNNSHEIFPQFEALKDVRIVDIEAESFTSILASEDGKIFVCGQGRYGHNYPLSTLPDGSPCQLRPFTSVPLDKAGRILSMSAHSNMLSVIVGRENGMRELYMQHLAAGVVGVGANERDGEEDNRPSGKMTLVLAGGGLDAPMSICLRRQHSLVLLLSGAIFVVASDTLSVTDWSSPTILGAKEKVVGLCIGKDNMRAEVVFLLGEHGTIKSFSRHRGGARAGYGRTWTPPSLAPGDRVLQIVGCAFGNTMFVTRKQRVFVMGYPSDGVLGVGEEKMKEGSIWEPYEVPLLLPSI
eukprot:TRINITY_DN4760_c1_g1_i2.p1 TRINITY_DN4760_c1_g1~~TRINITY_DN4760_c1_g1_i2.p1  ORF type:complete len:528 (+),score=46.98 TRINITY_DN4760_c1_g1_i2:158-1585(+)